MVSFLRRGGLKPFASDGRGCFGLPEVHFLGRAQRACVGAAVCLRGVAISRATGTLVPYPHALGISYDASVHQQDGVRPAGAVDTRRTECHDNATRRGIRAGFRG